MADVEAANAKVAAVQKAMDDLKTSIPEGVDFNTLPQRMAQLQAEKSKAETELAEAKAVAESLKARADELTASMETKDRTIQEYKSGYVRQGLSGKVVAYNPGWNFVVLNIGDKAGLKAGVQMVVLRGGNMVGKLKVTSVEPNTAIADVLPGTLARGDSVQPGDSVVFEGNRR
jgi:cell shape-determining protein MreC